MFKKEKSSAPGEFPAPAATRNERERERESKYYLCIYRCYIRWRARSRYNILSTYIYKKKRETIAFKKPAARRGQLCKCCVYAKYSRHSDYYPAPHVRCWCCCLLAHADRAMKKMKNFFFLFLPVDAAGDFFVADEENIKLVNLIFRLLFRSD